MFERFTDNARKAVVRAQEWAREHKNPFIGTEHLLLALSVPHEESVASQVLTEHGLHTDKLVSPVLALQPVGKVRPEGHLPLTTTAKKVLERSLRQALDLEHNYIGTEHLLLALTKERFCLGALALTALGTEPGTLQENTLTHVRHYGKGGRPPPWLPHPPVSLERVTHNLSTTITQAQREAFKLRHRYIGTEHLLLSMLAFVLQAGHEAMTLRTILENHGITYLETLNLVAERVAPGDVGSVNMDRRLPFSTNATKVLELALEEGEAQDEEITHQHLLVALLRVPEGIGPSILVDHGLHADSVRRREAPVPA